jgi:DNA repair exonuclease SbcCD ATPase subunit
MSIDAMMYFALGAFAAALVMLLIMPAIWRRAVRLTKKRIEAATPITLAEFRADKDQLRAEFALSTRRLEMNVEQLRKRLSEQLGDVSRRKTDLAVLKSERDEHLAVVRELEEREAELRGRIVELERESTDLAQRLSRRDEELAQQAGELGQARAAIRASLPPSIRADGKALTGNYDEDVDELLTALSVERKRASFLETQARGLLGQLEQTDKRSGDINTAMAELRRSLGGRDDAETGAQQNLVEAEVRIANAESRLNALLEETTEIVARGAQKHERLLAEKLSAEAQIEQLREKVLGVESSVLADWDSERLEQSHLRERLNDIASDVSRLIYAVDTQSPLDVEESLFDRVQRFADDGVKAESLPVRNGVAARPTPAAGGPMRGSVADRMQALRELQGRG